ncbi:hypothetical protein HDU76_005165 [Blyttiomyces sp. JEL0837]|nr:hypothetical protein HDU76_005165 [Blyttiomyces sp. JEL0837]
MTATAEENTRLVKLRRGFCLSLDQILQKLNQRNLASAFPKLAKAKPEQLEAVREQTVEFFKTAIEEEFEYIIETRSLPDKLAELDRFIANSPHNDIETRKLTEHVMVNPTTAVVSRLLELKQGEAARLRCLLQKKQNGCSAMSQEVQQKISTSNSIQSDIAKSTDSVTLGENPPLIQA